MKVIDKIWYQVSIYTRLLLPLSWLYCILVTLRRVLYWLRIIPSKRLPVPVIIVGNISVGGTGKTPLVIWLALKLREAGYHPGIISRGYKGKARQWPQQVRPDSDPVVVGDEPVIIARRTGCPMAVGPNRIDAARQLLKHHQCDVIISDDGLQHYRLRRDIEIAVVDSDRGLGNGYCLPAGPLRERSRRLRRVDFVVANNQTKPSGSEISMYLDGDNLINLNDTNLTKTIKSLNGKSVLAIAGIGNPKRFFEFLRQKGLSVEEHEFPDHHSYQFEDLNQFKGQTIVMTEKDAVKISRMAGDDFWYVPVEAKVQKGFKDSIVALLKVKSNG